MPKNMEEVSLNAWPALQQVVYDGWLLRFADGYTNRANSVNPIYSGSQDVEQKIQHCERLYSDQQLPVVFKITPFAEPANLDTILADHGYRQHSLTSVQTVALAEANLAVDAAVRRWDVLTEPWIAEFTRSDSRASENRDALKAILHNIVPSACYALLEEFNQPVACGLAVQEGEHIGLFDIVTRPTARRRGFAIRLISTLLHWGRQQGAKTAYLQVVQNNEAALRLYSKLGFREVYQYWYRAKP